MSAGAAIASGASSTGTGINISGLPPVPPVPPVLPGTPGTGAGLPPVVPIPIGIPDLPPIVTVDPVVQTTVCGVGAGVLGVGSSNAVCDGTQTSYPAPGPDPSLVNVNPVVQVGACGIGVGVLGSGSNAHCDGQQIAGSGPSQTPGGLANVSPTLQVDLCGIGVGLLGVGTTGTCANTPTAHPPAGGGTPPGSGGTSTGGGGTFGSRVDAAHALASPTAVRSTGSPDALAFTGFGTLIPAALGVGGCALGAVLLRMRRIA